MEIREQEGEVRERERQKRGREREIRSKISEDKVFDSETLRSFRSPLRRKVSRPPIRDAKSK